MAAGLFIGELAKQAQVTIDTIRYYEKCGLLPKPTRTAAGYRIYSPSSLERLIFIKQAQTLNLSLTEIGEILNFQTNDRQACEKVQSLLQEKMTDIDLRIKMLHDFRATLFHYLSQCNETLASEAASCCPVIAEIVHKPPTSIENKAKTNPKSVKR
jgi:DNA-binding transcriptional MerR regulator